MGNSIVQEALDQAFVDSKSGCADLDPHILGLVSVQLLYEGNVNTTGVLKSKTGFFYDESGSVQNTAAPPEQHDPAYGTNLVAGRGNLTSVKRYDVTSTAEITSVRSKYNIAGALTSSKDALDHETTIGYGDAFSDNVSRATFAYPTIVTDPDGHSTTTKYHFDFGAVTRRQTPQPNTATPQLGPERSWSYDSNGRLLQVTNLANNSYTRFEYPTSNNRLDTYTTITDDFVEAHSFVIADGAGRVVATATDHPGSEGGFSGQKFVYDAMGRTIKTSNPTETYASGAPAQWATAGDDASAGWSYTQQTYDWKGRPLVTTNPSMTSNPAETTTKVIGYSGCGCAGGEVITITDEGVTDATGALKKRQQKIYSDVLGRTVKTEILNWDGAGPNGTGGTVYAATTLTYNARDQVTLERRFAGPASSTTYQDTTMSYDGFGRLKNQHLPEQQVDVNNSASTDHTTWNYNNDGTVQSLTDARGVITTFTYNARQMVTATAFDSSNIPSGSNVVTTVNIAYGYDGAGNRTSMSDGSGSVDYHYDQLSRMDWEQRTFAGLPAAGVFRLSYEYNLGGVLTKVTDQHSGTSFTDTLDKVGRVTAVNAASVGGVQSEFVSNTKYRAWGGLKSRTQPGFTVNLTYNSRLLPTRYAMDGYLPVQMAYEYHNDGSIKYADEQTGLYLDVLDRAYAYDAASRLQQAYSGVEARNFVNNTTGGAPDGPYEHQYFYDQFDNLIQDWGRIWSRTINTADSYDVNNRVPTWAYDASGNVISRNELAPNFLPFHPAVYTYDAAGRQVGSTQTRTYATEYGNETSVFVNSQAFDGNNQMIHYALVRNVQPSNPQIPASTQTTAEAYLLRSTVLGSVISEYKADGAWSKTHVYAGAERLGEQTTAPNGTLQSRLENPDPITGDGIKHLADGSYFGMTTLDIGGIDVGVSDPFPPDGSGAEGGGLGELTKSVPYITPIEGGGARCILDGLEIECTRIRGDSSVQCPNNDCNATVTIIGYRQGREVGRWVEPAPAGWDPSYDGTYVFNDGWPWRRKGGDRPGRRRQLSNHASPSAPQNPQPLPTDLEDKVANIVNNPNTDCAEFIKKLIGNLKGKAFSDDPMKLFERVENGKGFRLGNTGKYAGLAGITSGKREVKIRPVGSTTDPRLSEHQAYAYAVTALNELMHHAKSSGVYLDRELAVAIFPLLSSEQQAANPLPKTSDVYTNSVYFHSLFNLHCRSLTGE